jgi:uncharacterized membrane protein YphA (DoxX/SURF4 family)
VSALPVRAQRSRVTGLARLALAVFLIGSAVRSLASPWEAVAEQGMPMAVVLPVAAISFTLGIFLLTGFMTRVCGLALVGIGVWQTGSFGLLPVPAVVTLAGIYFALRGGGAWAMDIYVQKMQDRVRQKALSEQ